MDRLARSVEQRLTRHFGRRHCLVTASGTTALYLAMVGAGLEPGSRVLYPDITCETAVNAAAFASLEPVFCDVDPATFNMDPSLAMDRAGALDAAAVVPTHIFGSIMDMAPLQDHAGGPLVLEDAAQAYGDGDARAAAGGRAAVVSFGPGKLLDCGGGGALLTDDDELMAACRRAAQGLCSDEPRRDLARTSLMQDLYRLRKAALPAGQAFAQRLRILREHRDGFVHVLPPQVLQTLSQRVDKLPKTAALRRRQTQTLRQALAGHPHVVLQEGLEKAAPWRFSFLAPRAARDRLFEDLLDKGFAASRLFPPPHHLRGDDDAAFPHAVEISERIVNLVLNSPATDLSAMTGHITDVLNAHGQ